MLGCGGPQGAPTLLAHPGEVCGLTAGPGTALHHFLQRVRDLPDPLVQVGGGVFEQRPGEGPEGCVAVG